MANRVAGQSDINGKIKSSAILLSDIHIQRTGSGAPSNALGIDGDFYLDIVSKTSYEKVSGSYIVRGILKSATITPIAEGGTGLFDVGTSLQVLRTNADATGLEYATVSLGGGSGDVVGPATATDNGFAKFDGTTGKFLKDSPTVVAIESGGTGAITASAARTALGVPQPSRVTFSQSNFAIPAGATYVAQVGPWTTLTAWVVTLPLANSVQAGFEITVIDETTSMGGFSGASVSVLSQGADTTIQTAFADVILDSFVPIKAISNGASKWILTNGSSVVLANGNTIISQIGPKINTLPFDIGHVSGIGQTGKIRFYDNQNASSVGSASIFGNGINLPISTTANRPSAPSGGVIRYNSDTLKTELYENSQWNNVIYNPSTTLPKITVFESSGTFTKNPLSKIVRVRMLGGGGGGGSGGKGLSTVIRTGGGGGGGASFSERVYDATTLSASETVIVGAAGGGGLSATVDSSLGNTGTAGGTSIFSTNLDLRLQAAGGGGGTRGANSGVAGTGGTTPAGYSYTGTIGGTAPATGLVGVAGSTGTALSYLGACGGGSGGGITAANVASAGGAGGNKTAALVGPAVGTAGAISTSGGPATPSVTNDAIGSVGSGGGGSSITTNAGSGGTQLRYGGGGGGGGAATNAVGNSGAGGNGGRGVVVVFEW
jgi:hypothetical protein